MHSRQKLVRSSDAKASKSSPPKRKGAGEQTSLDHFFSTGTGSPKKRKESSPSLPSAGPSKKHEVIVLDEDEDDESIARNLAASEGIDVETVRQLEHVWSLTTVQTQTDVADDTIPVVQVQAQLFKSVEAVENELAIPNSLNDGLVSQSQENQRDHTQRSNEPVSPPTTKIFNAKSQSFTIDEYASLNAEALTFQLDSCPWSEAQPAPYSFLAHTLTSVAETRSRNAILNILTNALRTIILYHPPSLLPSLYLLSNSLSPPYIATELGLGPASISKAIQTVSGLTPAALKRLYNKTGDAGDVAFEAKSNVRTLMPHKSLTITGVYDSLMKICNTKGEGAGKRKQAIVERLLVAAKGEETRYLVRTLSQHIRVGAVRTSILTALSRAMVLTRPKGSAMSLDDSPYYASPDQLSCVVAHSIQSPSKGKRKAAVEGSVRSIITEKFAEAERLLRKVYVQHPNYDSIVDALLQHGMEGLSAHVSLTVGIPLHHTLGSPTRSLDEVYERLNDIPFVAEYKYDGQRAQIHVSRCSAGAVYVKIFSRHLEDMTDKYPDVVFLIRKFFEDNSELHSAILDSEVVAFDPDNGELRSFQELSARPRKDVRVEDIKVPICVFAFDVMYLNAKSLLEQPFRARRSQLRKYFPPHDLSSPRLPRNAARFAHVEYCESEWGREKVEEFWQQALESRSEGLMIKLLDGGDVLEEESESSGRSRKKPLPATYEPDKRTSAWLKLKKDYVDGLGDSLDLVPIGAWHGNGRKAQWWSPILLALWDERQSAFVAVCKCMSGFSDEFYKALNVRYVEGSDTCSRTPLWNCTTGGLTPEVYFKPQEVWECKGADVTLSPVSAAAYGRVSQTRGLSVRFPRFIRVREDKGTHDASTPEFLVKMWEMQEQKGKTSTANDKANDDGELVDAYEEEAEIGETDEYEE